MQLFLFKIFWKHVKIYDLIIIRLGRGLRDERAHDHAVCHDRRSWITYRSSRTTRSETFSQPLFPRRTGCESGRLEPGSTRYNLVEIRLKGVDGTTRLILSEKIVRRQKSTVCGSNGGIFWFMFRTNDNDNDELRIVSWKVPVVDFRNSFYEKARWILVLASSK